MVTVNEMHLPGTGLEGGHEERCLCNKLVCILRGDIIEIKCNKCKRLLWIHTKGIIKTEMING